MREGSFLVSKGLTGPHKYDHVIERYLDTVRVLGGRVDAIEFPLPDITGERRAWRQRLAADGLTGPYVAIVPGARWSVKEWPLSHWQEFLQRLTASGMAAVLLGSGDDVPKGKALKDHDSSGQVFDYTGRTDLRQLMAAIAESALYISADTGPLHMANALKKNSSPSLGRRVPSGPALTAETTTPTSTWSCRRRPRRRRNGPWSTHPDCMAQITPDALWQVYEGVLKKVEL